MNPPALLPPAPRTPGQTDAKDATGHQDATPIGLAAEVAAAFAVRDQEIQRLRLALAQRDGELVRLREELLRWQLSGLLLRAAVMLDVAGEESEW